MTMNKYKKFSKAKDFQKNVLKELRGCTVKKHYESKEDAERGMPPSQKIYKCKHCDGFHRTSNSINTSVFGRRL